MEDSKSSRKQRVWMDFKNQEAYREGMRDVVGDQPVFDPRLFDERSKDGKFKKQSKNKNFIPKNILTIQYLIYAYDVSYPTFKRWRSEGFMDTKYVPAHTGKSVMTDPEYAKQIYTARRMYVTSAMDVWKEKQLKTYGKIDAKARREHCAKKKEDWNALSVDEKEPFEKIARDKHVRQALMVQCVTEALQKKTGGNCLRSFRSLANATDNWCSHVTIMNWLQRQPTYATYSKNVRPGLTEANRTKQVEFGKHVHAFWNLPPGTKVLWTMSDEKWWHGLVLRTFAKMCPALGIDKEIFTCHHKNHIGKVMAHATVGYCFSGDPENGGEGVLVGLHRCQAFKVALRKHVGQDGNNYNKGDVIAADCNVTGTDVGTPSKPKYPLKSLWQYVLLPALEALVAPGGRCAGATVVHQEDNAGPHKEGNYHTWLQAEFEQRGWKLELNAPQVPRNIP
jgi:hypothetical protein